MNNLVIGLDHNSNSFHWVSTEPIPGSKLEPTRYGLVKTKDQNVDLRRIYLYLAAKVLFEAAEQTGSELEKRVHVFAEEPLALQNGKTTRLLALAAGALWAAAAERNLWWHWVDVAHWKKQIVGKGNASKDDVGAFCRSNPGFQAMARSEDEFLNTVVTEPDLYDAWCLRAHGIRFLAQEV